MRKIIVVFICAASVILLKESPCMGYLTKYAAGIAIPASPGAHEEFTKYAIERLDIDYNVRKVLNDNEESITGGNAAEDNEALSNAFMHFYDPNGSDDQRGLFGFPAENAKTRARGYYEIAKKYYQNPSGVSTAWGKIGRALHLLQDMAVPAHVHRANHLQHSTIWKNGYEWWVARNWDNPASDLNVEPAGKFYLKPYIDNLLARNPYFKRPIRAGTMDGYMDAMAIQTYYGYEWDNAPPIDPVYHVVSDEESKHTASILVPTAIQVSGGLLQGFCKEVNCTGSPVASSNNTGPGGGNPDDNFDVSSRLIELEELDVTKQAWKDLYGRTGIKKGYNELFLGKLGLEVYAKLAAITDEAEFNAAVQQYTPLFNSIQKEVKHSFEDTYYASADVALLSDAFVENAAELLLKRLKEPIREVKETLNPAVLLKNQPVLLVPSGALTGFNDSPMLKASLDEYVKQGGTLIVLSQKHGYDYASIPTPDGRPITGYGWEEDQNCFADSVAIESWHQMLSGQSRSTPTLNVDGYFTGYPANATVLLRRTANGQPALLMYEHGLGRVVVTSMYSDWAYGHGQASQEEIALIRDLLSWAKKPALLPEIKPGEAITVPVTLSNSTATDAASIKLQIWNPDRSTLLLEQSVSTSIPAGQSVINNVTWQAPSNVALGIYHIDYILLDAAGNIIQPQAETDSGRFVVSNPPQVGTVKKDIWLSITSPNQEVFFGEPFVYTFHIFNNSATTRNLTLKTLLPHTDRTHEWTVTATANGETTISGSDLFIDNHWMFETLRAYLYDENNVQIGSYMLSFKGIYPSVEVTTSPGKETYAKGEKVVLAVTLKNGRSAATAVKVGVTVADPFNSVIYTSTQDLTLDANGAANLPFSFPLAATAQGGVYAVSTEVKDAGNVKIGGDATSFELPLSQVAIVPAIPVPLIAGSNSFTFSLNNGGKLPVTGGTLDLSLLEPGGATVASASQSFTLDPSQVKSVALALTVPPLKFGKYTLVYAQNDETKTGRPATVTLANATAITATFDKPSYRIRETVNLTVNLANSGRFNLENAIVTMTMPDAGFTETRTVTIGQGQALPLPFTFPLPVTMNAGQHGIIVTVSLPSGSTITENVSITIPAASLIAADTLPAYTAGSTVALSLRNTGGIDAVVESTISLYDADDLLIATKTDNGAIAAGGERLITLPVPAQAADGNYRLLLSYLEPGSDQLAETLKNVRINGMIVTLSAATNKEVFLSTESVGILTTISNQGAAINGATLSLKVVPAVTASYVDNWGQNSGWKGLRQQTDINSSPKDMRLEHRIKNGNFEYGDLTGWTTSRTLNGLVFIVRIGTDFSAFPTQQIPIDGIYSIDIRSNGPGYTNTWGVLTSDAFVPVDNTLNWIQFSENPSVYLEYRILDSNMNTLKTASLPIITGNFGAQQIDISPYKGQPIRVEFRQHTNQFGLGWFTLLDDIRNGNAIYPQSGTFESETKDYGVPVEFNSINWVATTPANTSVRFQIATNMDNSSWNYLGPDGTSNTYYDNNGGMINTAHNGNRYLRWKNYLDTGDTTVTPVLHSLTISAGEGAAKVLWQNNLMVDMPVNTAQNLISTIDSLTTTEKLILQATLTNSVGQTIARSENSFYVAEGDMLLSVNPDKKTYKPGETVNLSGEVKNLANVDASNLTLTLNGQRAGGVEQSLATEVFNIPAGGSHPFAVATTAGLEGTVTLTGTVTQGAATLVQIADKYVVSAPRVTASVTMPDFTGNDPFAINVGMRNDGKTDAIVSFTPSITSQAESVTIPAGQKRLFQYIQKVTADTSYTFAFTGDLNQTIEKTVKYGLAGTITVTPQTVYLEGKVSLSATITNTGLLDSPYNVAYHLLQGEVEITRQSIDYFVPKGASSTDTLSFELTEGSYQIIAQSSQPAAAAAAGFQVRKEIKADLTLTVGTQSNSLLPTMPTTVNVTNLGYLPIEGSIRLSLIAANGAAVWSAAQEVSLPQALLPAPNSLAFSINLAPLKPGGYTVKAELLDAGNRELASRTAPFNLLGPTIAISQLPQYRTISSGGSSDFIYKVKNSGNQEGSFELTFKADDLVNSSRSGWLKPGEEQEIAIALQTASDLEEKDYFATYSLKSGSVTLEQGTVKYHLQGINLTVTASLDKQSYNPGDTATLTLNVTQQDTGAAPILFARVNYNGYNEKQTFNLNGSQTLVFNVPLTQITGEKLFYGIYSETGRSIHLNTIYVYMADSALAIITDKQVYNPGETVAASIMGSASGDLSLTGPGDFATTFAYSGSDTKSFTLPATMIAGTYTIKAQLKTLDSQLITASHPFDVAGIQVKVKEALLDRAKYSATDTMRLTLTIESNRDIPVTVRTWIVDPAGTYTEAGSGDAALTAAAPLLTTQNSALTTASLGIHKLVYGIYQGDLLLASGAKAFDIGEAVLLSLATDRSDYPEITLPVTVKADLYGTVATGIELFLDGVSIKSDAVTLSGLGNYTFTIPPASVTPGLHTLKAVLTVGGLTSSRETRFTYGSSLPDLTARIASQPLNGGIVNLSLTVANQGKIAAGASSAALYDGDPTNGGQLLSTLNVPAIAAGSSVTLPYAWNVLGKSGDHVLFAVADSDNSVVEFIEGNNRAMTAVSFPSLSLAVTTGKSAYEANEAAAISVSIANLTANLPLESSTLKLRLTSASGTTTDLPDKTVATIAPATLTTLSEVWNTGITEPSGYTITALLVTGATELASATGSFTIVPTTSLSGSFAPVVAEIPQDSALTALFTISNSGNIPVDGRLQGIIRDPQSGIIKEVQEIPLQLPVAATKTGTFSFPVSGLLIKGYDLFLSFVSTSGETVVAQSQFTIKDTIPPTLAVSTLSDGSYTNLETLNVAGSVQDNSDNVKVAVNGVLTPVAVDGSFSYALLLNGGANTITTIAADGANNKTLDTRTITLDQSAPALTISSPADNSKTAVSPVEIKGSVDETSTVTVKVKENVQSAAMNGTAFSATVIPAPGWNTIEITATDLADNTSSQKRSVLFDDQKPSLAVTEPPQDIRTNKSSLTISGNTSDPYTAVGITIASDGTILTPAVLDGIFSQVVTFTDEKLYPLTVTATNEVGTQTSVQRNVIFDKTPPNLTIDPVVTPTNAPAQTVTGTREEGRAVVFTCATATVGAVEYPTATSWRVSIAGLQQGENLIQAGAVDLAGNRTTAVATILYVPKAPEVTISASPNQLWPPNKKLVPVVITGNVITFGSDVRDVTISVADEYGKYNLPGLKFGDTLLLEAWRDGNDMDGRVYTITAVVTDQAGNRTTRSTTVVVPHDMGK